VYFWNIEALKSSLRAGGMEDRSAIRYLLCLGGVTLAGYSVLPLLGRRNAWDTIDEVVWLVAFLAGTYFVYRRNGGAAGRDFLPRFLSLTWVFGIRFSVMVTLPCVASVVVLETLIFGSVPELTTPYESAVNAGLAIVYVFGLARHVAACSAGGIAAQPGAAG